jgi:alpha-ketoglutarate-dependent taurine dioxygenase
MTYRTIEVQPVSGALGAEISGVDLARDLDDGVIGEVRRALVENCVIFFRGQKLTPERQIAFGRRFGALQVHDFVAGMNTHPEIIEVRKEEDELRNFGGVWHTDVSYLEKPALGSVLYALEVPAYGGDTLFSNQYLAYETLSDGMKSVLGGMQAVHSARTSYGLDAPRVTEQVKSSMPIRFTEAAHGEVSHPVVRTHVESGKKALYVNGGFTIRFADMTEAESAPLLHYLYDHAVRPEFTCRFRWEKGSVAFWDNRCVQHNAVNDYHGQRRVMHRVAIEGERPI